MVFEGTYVRICERLRGAPAVRFPGSDVYLSRQSMGVSQL